MPNEDFDTIDLPAVGEIRARRGTSTIELAGAAKHWHTKWKTAWIDGVVTGGLLSFGVSVIAALIYYYLRSH